MERILKGKLVRILDGRMWDLWTEEGHAGLERVLRQFEGREVRVVIGDAPAAMAEARAEELEKLEAQAVAAAAEVKTVETKSPPSRRGSKKRRVKTGKQGKAGT